MTDDSLARITTVQGHDVEVSIDGAEGIAFWIMDHTDEEWTAFGFEDGRELYAALGRLYAEGGVSWRSAGGVLQATTAAAEERAPADATEA